MQFKREVEKPISGQQMQWIGQEGVTEKTESFLAKKLYGRPTWCLPMLACWGATAMRTVHIV
jgi:hypothetical protein